MRNRNTQSDTYSDGNSYSYSDSDSNSHCAANCYADAHTDPAGYANASPCADAEESSYSAAAAFGPLAPGDQ